MKTTNKKVCDSILACIQSRSIVFEKNGFPILECVACHHRFVKIPEVDGHLETVYSDDYFFSGDQGYPNYLESKKILIKSGRQYAKIINRYRKPGKVLDVGAAAGFILKGFELEGWECRGLEPNDRMADFGRNELKLDITTGNLESFHTDEQFDLANLIQVIGHFYDLDAAVRNIISLLKPDGHVLVESWNMNSSYARMLGKNWPEYMPPSVVHWFSTKTLTQLFDYYGLDFVASGYPIKRIKLGHALSVLRGRKKENEKESQINLISAAIGKITLFYPPLDLKWYVFKRR